MFNFSSELIYQNQLRTDDFSLSEDLLIVDRILLSSFAHFVDSFSHIYVVDAGEDLKSLESLPGHIRDIINTWGSGASRDHRIITLGGGSVGDFAGFVASILKRGVQLIHIPSTWLSAVDSAHGGKTALNVEGAKNQLGTFYPAQRIFMVKELLFSQSKDRAKDAMGEVIKMSLISPEPFLQSLLGQGGDSLSYNDVLWSFLRPAVDGKYSFITDDPYEKKGIRKALNLGHTFGHVLEAYTGKSHGDSVLQGLYFSLLWSQAKVRLPEEVWTLFRKSLSHFGLSSWLETGSFEKIPFSEAKKYLIQDKKSFSDGDIDFVFLKNQGEVLVSKVAVEDILTEAQEQGWVD